MNAIISAHCHSGGVLLDTARSAAVSDSNAPVSVVGKSHFKTGVIGIHYGRYGILGIPGAIGGILQTCYVVTIGIMISKIGRLGVGMGMGVRFKDCAIGSLPVYGVLRDGNDRQDADDSNNDQHLN